MVEVLLHPLHPGTIRDIFSRKRSAPARKQSADPLGLPQIETQCVHVEAEELSEGVEFTRCTNDAVFVGERHGWLCLEHQPTFLKPRGQGPRDKDAEIVAGIIAYERRALAGSRREVVKIGPSVQIQYLVR